MKHIVIVPTSHVAKQSIRAVRKVILEEKPDCVAVELDMNRFVVMESGESSNWDALRSLGPWSFAMFFIMRTVQNWLGRKVGILPGSDMLSAVREAEKVGTHIAFIDRNMSTTMARLGSISRREKVKLVLFLVKGLTMDSIFARIGMGKQVKIDLDKVPSRRIIDEVLDLLKTEFPGFYRVLVSERDRYMAARLAGLASRYDRIVAVVGAAHSSGIEAIFKSLTACIGRLISSAAMISSFMQAIPSTALGFISFNILKTIDPPGTMKTLYPAFSAFSLIANTLHSL
jgi:pheromone shutdown-related protein TraB